MVDGVGLRGIGDMYIDALLCVAGCAAEGWKHDGSTSRRR